MNLTSIDMTRVFEMYDANTTRFSNQLRLPIDLSKFIKKIDYFKLSVRLDHYLQTMN